MYPFFFLSAYTGGSCSLAEHYLPDIYPSLGSEVERARECGACLAWIVIEHWESKLTTYGHQGITA